jgi:pimeloyl-ACP methyl ester carboxylesterase
MLIFTILYNLFISLPSLVFYGTIKLYRRCRYILTEQQEPIPVAQNRDVIVLIHGRNGHPIDFYSLIQQLKPSFGNKYEIFSIHLRNTGTTRVDEDVESLRERLEFLTNCRIVMIGHSKGGVIACRYLALTQDPRIQKIITVASPLYGTEVANYVGSIGSHLSNSIKVVSTDLNYQNWNLFETERKLSKHGDKLYHIISEKDHVIIPSSSSRYGLTPKENLYFYSGNYNHCCLFDDSRIVNAIKSWLSN